MTTGGINVKRSSLLVAASTVVAFSTAQAQSDCTQLLGGGVRCGGVTVTETLGPGGLHAEDSSGRTSTGSQTLSGGYRWDHDDGGYSVESSPLGGGSGWTHSDGTNTNISKTLGGSIRYDHSDGSSSILKENLGGGSELIHSDPNRFFTGKRDRSPALGQNFDSTSPSLFGTPRTSGETGFQGSHNWGPTPTDVSPLMSNEYEPSLGSDSWSGSVFDTDTSDRFSPSPGDESSYDYLDSPDFGDGGSSIFE